MSFLLSVKSATEDAVIALVAARAYQRRIGQCTIALAEAQGVLGMLTDARPETWARLAAEATVRLYVAGDYVAPPTS